jgi:hypothetical protein
MRSWIYNRIKAIAGMPGGMVDRVISTGSNATPDAPFLIVAMGTESSVLGMPAEAGVAEVPFTVWVHDAPGSMLNIDAAAHLLKDNLPGVTPAVVGGVSVYECRWNDTGEDAYDDHYHTNTRPVRFRLVIRK